MIIPPNLGNLVLFFCGRLNYMYVLHEWRNKVPMVKIMVEMIIMMVMIKKKKPNNFDFWAFIDLF